MPAVLLGLAALSAAPVHSQTANTPELEDIRAQIRALRAEQARIAELQRQTDAALHALESKLSSEATPVPAAVAASAKASPEPRLPSSANAHLHLNGDLRLRYQGDYSDSDSRKRDSGQIRARLGGAYEVNDHLTLGARLATGDADDPNSTDVQLSNFDDDLEATLDMAYAQLNVGEVTLFGGKFPQPFTRTDLVWDSDVNPQGASATYKKSLAQGFALHFNTLYFVIDEQVAGDDSTMRGAQVGFDRDTAAWKYELSAAYYDYSLGSVSGGDAGDYRSNLRSPDGRYRSDFDLVDFIAAATWPGRTARWPVRMVGDYVHNLGAATSADTAYSIDVTFGRAAQLHDWRVTYGYSIAETDAVFAAFSHDNIGIATNYKLHALTFDYVPYPKTLISAIWSHYAPLQAIDAGANSPGDWLDRLRIAFLVNF
jgi:Putative porin